MILRSVVWWEILLMTRHSHKTETAAGACGYENVVCEDEGNVTLFLHTSCIQSSV